ncbi:hypothetical protein [Romboutsia lituseburensis]|uniref:hypothetical protein n=1 Tax=Romboutsia lituseburensis TaxID=1537 RepID=UPI0022EB0B2A|nr:hypothetical protein [Romboutsia lituseburensis]
MQLVKIYMKSGNVVDLKCSSVEVAICGEELEGIEVDVIDGPNPVFIDMGNVDIITNEYIKESTCGLQVSGVKDIRNLADEITKRINENNARFK